MALNQKTTVAAVIGAAFSATLAFSPLALAETSPFSVTTLESGYLQLAEHHDHDGHHAGEKKDKDKHQHKHKDKTREGKCSDKKDKNKDKAGEGNYDS